MKKLFVTLFVLLSMLLTTTAFADRMYVLPDSDTRRLTRAEVEVWDYDSLGYAFNEIFARHGYNFIPGDKYDNYFRTMPWYTPNANPDNETACYPQLSDVEWYNYYLIKDVRAYKKYNDWGRSIWDIFSTGFSSLQGFDYIELQSNQVLYVYSAPSTASWRGANGKAEVSTNGAIYAAGFENGWMLLMYETNNGSVRVGYVDASRIRGSVPMYRQLQFAYDPAVVDAYCTLTDDPARTGSAIAYLQPGTEVTYLTTFFNHTCWDYVEVRVGGQVARGFIPAGNLYVDAGADPLEGIEYDVPVLLD